MRPRCGSTAGAERVHLDLSADDAAEQAASVERPVVPADTGGNRLHVIDESFG
ncbi:hypothetical protein [Actinacidiphila glaucinigra]